MNAWSRCCGDVITREHPGVWCGCGRLSDRERDKRSVQLWSHHGGACVWPGHWTDGCGSPSMLFALGFPHAAVSAVYVHVFM